MFQYILILSAVAFVAKAGCSHKHANITRELMKEHWIIAASGVSNRDQTEDQVERGVEQCIWFSARPTKQQNVCIINGVDHVVGSVEFIGVSGIAKEDTLAVGPIYEVSDISKSELLKAIKSMQCRDAKTHKGKRLVFAISQIDDSLDYFLLMANTGGPKHFVLQTSIITKEFISLPKLKYLIAAVNPKETSKEPSMIAKCYL